MTHDAPEHIVEVLPRVHITCLAGLNQAVEQCSSLAATLAAGE